MLLLTHFTQMIQTVHYLYQILTLIHFGLCKVGLNLSICQFGQCAEASNCDTLLTPLVSVLTVINVVKAAV